MTHPRELAGADAQHIRAEHQPAACGSRCAICGEPYPCQAIMHADAVLDRLEARQISAATPAAD